MNKDRELTGWTEELKNEDVVRFDITPPDLRDTQPMETLTDVRRYLRSYVIILLVATLLWAAIVIGLLLVFA